MSRSIFVCIVTMLECASFISSRFFKKLYAWGCPAVWSWAGLI